MSDHLRDHVAAALRGDGQWDSLSESQKAVWRADADRAIKALQKAAALPAPAGVEEWRTMDSAPKDGTIVDVWFVLCTGDASRWPYVRWDQRRERWSGGPTDQGLGHWYATHWRPLPAPPTILAKPAQEGQGL